MKKFKLLIYSTVLILGFSLKSQSKDCLKASEIKKLVTKNDKVFWRWKFTQSKVS
jgi:hypothetical protein